MTKLKVIISLYSFLVLLVLSGCSSGDPRPINYGTDGCHFCKMTIVDKIHGAELITEKGKIYTFDALECMISFIRENEIQPNARYLSNVYERPEILREVEQLTFLISENLPSPMGGNLTAFDTRETAYKIMKEKEGALYSWEDLLKRSHIPQSP